MIGHVQYDRRAHDSTLIPVGDEILAQGEVLRVVRATRVPQQSALTRLLDAITGGLWPWGKTVRVDVVREDRSVPR